MFWKALCTVSLLTTVAVAQAQVTGLGKWFDEQVARRVTLTGYRRLAYHSRTVSGDSESYGATEYGGRGLDRFTDFGQVRVTGTKVLGVANFDLNIQDSRFTDPQANRFSIDVERGGWTANLGDIRGSLSNDNRFATFEKSLTGVQAGYKSRRFTARAIVSEVRGQPRTVSVQGNNTAGPYYLQSSQIVRGSETVQVDGVDQKFGQDYTIDYDLGSITFVNRTTLQGRIIPPTSTIVATYEVFGFNGSRGRVEAAAASYDFGKLGKVGLTAMRQVQGVESRDSTFQEQFLGPINAGSTIGLRNEPLDIFTVKVFIGSVLQTLNVGYRFNPQNKSLLILLRDVPVNTVLTVIYTPKPVNTVQGDRSVLGLDYRIPLGKNGTILYSQALGRLTNATVPTSGTARGLDLRYVKGPWEVNGSVRDVPDGYVSVETIGFTRNEKSADLGVRYRPVPGVEYGILHRNSSISSFESTTPTSSRVTSLSAFANLVPKDKGNPLTLSQSRISVRNPSGGSQVDTTMVATSGAAGRSDWRLDLSNQFASGLTTVGGDRQNRKLNLQTLGYRLNYRASDAWDLFWNSSLSRVATSGENSIGRDLSLGASFRPDDRFQVRAEIADSDAGQLASLGFLGGYGVGYGGNGFSNGTDGSTFTNATNARTALVSVNYDPTDRLSLHGNLNYYQTKGGVSSNTESVGFGFGGNWKVNDAHDLDFSFDNTRTRFFDSPLESTTTVLSLYLNGEPKGRLTYRGGINVLLATGNSEFNQDSFGYELGLNYRLAKRHSLSFLMDNGSLRGFQPQETRNIALTYQYQIWRSLAFNIGYRMIDVINRDPRLTSGAYSSKGFDFELSFNFGR